MKERPILFSGPMVRALLDGSKTQTRRVIAKQPADGWAFDVPPQFGRITSPHPKKGRFGAFIRHGVGTDFPSFDLMPCPYGMPGDRLWVRETHEVNRIGCEEDEDGAFGNFAGVAYRADNGRAQFPISQRLYDRLNETESSGWTPSIHMPRWTSRITLEVTGVRVERLQDISEADAAEEGVESLRGEGEYWKDYLRSTEHCDELICLSARESFRTLWDRINGEGAWAANPWVWVVEFKRLNASGEQQ
jgi:hypothetical protein